MEKWADYGISAVKFDKGGTKIDKVKVHKDKGNAMGDAELWSREQVISALENDYTFMTIFNHNQDIWSEGDEVNIVQVNGNEYIRTDNDQTPSDSLDNLPKLSSP